MCGAATARCEADELDDLLEEGSIWEQFYTLRAGVGYSDNILFSDLNRQASSMLVTGFDTTLFRVPLAVDASESSTFELGYRVAWRDYDTRPGYCLDGSPLPGSRLAYFTKSVDAEWKQGLDAQGGLRAYRSEGRSVRAFAENSIEQALFNLSYDRYRVNVNSAGVDWEF